MFLGFPAIAGGVHRRTGGLEIIALFKIDRQGVHRRTGGLEKNCIKLSLRGYVHRRTGGLEIPDPDLS